MRLFSIAEGLAGQVDDPFLSDDVWYWSVPVSGMVLKVVEFFDLAVFSDFKYLFLRFVYNVTYVCKVFVFAFVFNASFNFVNLRLDFINYFVTLPDLTKIDLWVLQMIFLSWKVENCLMFNFTPLGTIFWLRHLRLKCKWHLCLASLCSFPSQLLTSLI